MPPFYINTQEEVQTPKCCVGKFIKDCVVLIVLWSVINVQRCSSLRKRVQQYEVHKMGAICI